MKRSMGRGGGLEVVALKLVLDALRVSEDSNLGKVFGAYYLAEAAGVCIAGYNVEWSSAGHIYIPNLADTFSEIKTDLASGCNPSEGYSLDKKSAERLRQLVPLFEEGRALWFLSSVHYLSAKNGIKNPVEIKDTFRKFGKSYPISKIKKALKTLDDYGLGEKA